MENLPCIVENDQTVNCHYNNIDLEIVRDSDVRSRPKTLGQHFGNLHLRKFFTLCTQSTT